MNPILDTKAESQNSLQMPWPVPPSVTKINQAIAKIYDAKTADEKNKVANELTEEINVLISHHTLLYKNATKVTETVLPRLNNYDAQKKKASKSLLAAKKAAQELAEAVDKIKFSPTEISKNLEVTPNYLPNIRGLSSSLKQLESELQALMKNAKDPSNPIDIETVKLDLAGLCSRYQELDIEIAKISKPITKATTALDKIVEEMRERTAEISITKALSDWQLEHIDVFANVFSNLSQLQRQTSAISSDAENLKVYLRANHYTEADPVKLAIRAILSNPEEHGRTLKVIEKELKDLISQYPETALTVEKEALTSLLNGKPETKIGEALTEIGNVLDKLAESPVDNATRDFEAIKRKYNEARKEAEGLREATDKAIRDLDKLIHKADADLQEIISQIPFHDTSVSEKISKATKEAVDRMQGERRTILNKIESLWKSVLEQFTSKHKGHLYYDINRIGYAIFENYGEFPKDLTYGTFWDVKNPYVPPLSLKEGVAEPANG